MLKKLKKQSIMKGLGSVFTCLFMCVLLIALGYKDYKDIKEGPKEYTTLTKEDITKGLCVKASFTENFGSYMEEQKEDRRTGKKTLSGVCYLVEMTDAQTGEFYLVSLAVTPEFENEMEKMADNTYLGLTSKPMEYTCQVKKMTSQDYNYATFYLQQMGLETADIHKVLLPYHMVYRDWDAKAKLAYILCGSGAFFGAIAALLLLYTLSGARLGKIKKEISKSGYSFELAEADFENARVLMEKPIFRVGRVFTFLYQGAIPHIIQNKDICWGFYYVVTERGRAGLKKVTHMVGIRTVDKKGYVAEVPNEGRAHYILNMMNAMMPWMVVGSDEAFEKMYHRNLDEFLELRYNKTLDKTTKIDM